MSMAQHASVEPSEDPAKGPDKLIFQTWKTRTLPEWALGYHESWKRHNPDWKIVVWSDDDCREFVARNEPSHLAMYDAFPKNIMRVDFVRYAWLKWIGCLYVDADFECLTSFEPLRRRYALVLGRSCHGVISNSIMMSVKGHPFWDKVMKEISVRFERIRGKPRLFPSLDVLNTTGPNVVHAVAKRCGYVDPKTRPSNVFLAPPKTFFPYSSFEWWKKGKKTFPSDTMAVHRHRSTWCPHIQIMRVGATLGALVLLIVVVVMVTIGKLRSTERAG